MGAVVDDERQPEPEGDEAAAFQRDLYLYWRAAGEIRGLPLTSRGYVSRQALRQVRARLALAGQRPPPEGDPSEVEEPHLYFLRRLLERLRLLRPAPDAPRLLAAENAEMGRYVALPLAGRLRLATRLWVAGGWWPERLDATAAPAGVMAPAPPRVALARRRALDTILAAGPGSHVPALRSAEVPAIRAASRSRSPRRIRTQGTGRDTTSSGTLVEPLAWLGILAPDAAGRGYVASAVATALSGGEDGSADGLTEAHGAVAALPNLTLIAYPPFSAPALWLLDAIAEETSLQQTATYTLTAESVARGRRLSLGGAEQARRLEALTGRPLPANVRTTLADWERRAARVQLLPAACVLEVRDASLLDALFADPAAAAWRERRLAPTVALVKPEGADAARAWLLRRGQLPARLTPPEAPGEEG